MWSCRRIIGEETPEQVTVYFVDEQFQPSGTQLLCAYPEVAVYDGMGDPKNVASLIVVLSKNNTTS